MEAESSWIFEVPPRFFAAPRIARSFLVNY